MSAFNLQSALHPQLTVHPCLPASNLHSIPNLSVLQPHLHSIPSLHICIPHPFDTPHPKIICIPSTSYILLFATIQSIEPSIHKARSDSLSCGLFLICRGENICLKTYVQHSTIIHAINSMCGCGVYKCKKDALLLGTLALCTKNQTSSLAGPMLRVNCIFFCPLA